MYFRSSQNKHIIINTEYQVFMVRVIKHNKALISTCMIICLEAIPLLHIFDPLIFQHEDHMLLVSETKKT